VFAALGLGVGATGEYLAINRARRLRHHTRPQVRGVPVGAVLAWYTIMYAAFATMQTVISRRHWPWAVPLGAATLATSLDLVLDCYGLDAGLWEWATDGPYARELVGPNGRRGIPRGNFLGWILMTAGVCLSYMLVAGERTDYSTARPLCRLPALILLPYYLVAAIWARQPGRRRFLVYSSAAPALIAWSLARALKPQRANA
jgi:uncharacterized membrane protein